jgi:hypothetical protein
MKTFQNTFLAIGLVLTLLTGAVVAGENNTKRTKRAEQRLDIKVTAWGPTQEMLDAAKVRVERSAELQSLLKGAKYRLLEFGYIETENKSGPSVPPTRFRAVFYDYTNDRTIVAESDFAARESIVVHEEFYQPVPNDEEFDEAVAVLKNDKRFASSLKEELLKPFRPMPPTTVLDGTMERLVNIGLDSGNGAAQNEVVSVSIKRGEAIRYDNGAPSSSMASPDACGIAPSGQGTTSAGTAGQYQLTVTEGQTTLWEMLIIRQSASSGASGKRSGIEVRDVKYKGKSVLKRGHVPILNVQYTDGQCGPYRDWQYQEDMFQVPTTGTTYPNGPTGGIAIVPDGQIATTALESGSDTGTFKGVAVYKQDVGNGMETVLITELQAGWYRYIMEWRFAPDGTIRPRFGFGATDNSCVCFSHNHHVYWRLDFDIVQASNKIFRVERGRKFLKSIETETFINRNFQSKRSLLIQNSNGDEAYQVSPNISDGTADTFGVHDMWALHYQSSGGNPTQLEDGITCVTCSTAFIQIDPFINGESLVNQDAVVWYGAHFLHNDQGNLQLNPDRTGMVISGSHVVGPDLRPVRW